MNIPPPIASQPIVEPNRTMSDPFRLWSQQVTAMQMQTGSGSPEGVLSAPVTTLYMNTAGTAGSILYIKRDTDISADPARGWILV